MGKSAFPVRKPKYLIFLAAYLFYCNSMAYLGTVPPSYKIEIGDARYIFVMLQRDSTEPLLSKSSQPYPASGLYLNDGSTVPLWTVDWYEEREGIFLTEDRACLVRIGKMFNIKDKDIQFFNTGQFIKSYSIEELIPDFAQIVNTHKGHGNAYFSELRRSVISKIYLDSLNKTIRIHFITGSRFIFDLASGKIISKKTS